MRKILLLSILACLSVCICAQTAYYKSDNAPTAAVTVIPMGIALQLEGENPVTFSPAGMNNQFMFYSCSNANVMFTLDMQSMVISINGRNYSYTLSRMENSTVTPYNPGYTPAPNKGNSNRAYYQSEIDQLEYKIRDAERSLRSYERSYDKNPTVTGSMLIREQQKLIQTYQDRIIWLRSQLY